MKFRGMSFLRSLAEKDTSLHIHECLAQPEDCAITYVDGHEGGKLFQNSNAEGRQNFPTLLTGIQYCPFCGKRFAEADAATEAIEDELRGGLACIDAVGYKNMSRASVERASRVQWALSDGDIQITIIDPSLARAFTPKY